MPPFLTYILRPLIFFAVTVLLFVIQRYCFMMFYPEIYSGLTALDKLKAIWYGLSMDCSMAGYLTIIPLLLSMVCIWLPERTRTVKIPMVSDRDAYLEVAGTESILGHTPIRCIVISYSILCALVLSIIAVLDAAIYPIWGFKLDINPLFYFYTSPKTVMDSISGSQLTWGIVTIAAVAIVWSISYLVSWNIVFFKAIKTLKARIITFAGLILMGGALFVVIRGGVTVSTMNLSRAYFSTDQNMNHAAINPAFSLFSSSIRRIDEAEKYSVYPSDHLAELISMVASFEAEETPWKPNETYLATKRPDIVIIILESFSSHLLPSQGGEPIATNIDREARQGLLFTNAYASGFRTDRGIPAILNAFPGLPDISITKSTTAIERLPSIGTSLKNEGYDTNYYYGGDLNFTNMKALLVAGGFKNMTGDTDFPFYLRSAKWGVLDHHLFSRVKEEMRNRKSTSPQLSVIQTSSSHEPFTVPFKKLENPAANAFAYTDSVVGDFMRYLRNSPRWNNTLVVLVPDHYGAYPANLPDMESRHHIPIIFTGGALKMKGTDDVLMSQTDIVPTILSLMDIDNQQFLFGRNVFDKRYPPMVYYYDRELAYLKSSEGEATLNPINMEIESMPSDNGVDGVISPFNPATQLHAIMQVLGNAYNPK